MQTQVNWEELGIEANQDRRRESRIALTVPIEVTGFDLDGKFFTELTKTLDISESGCCFSLKRCVERGGIVAVKVRLKDRKRAQEQRPLLYQVARATSEASRWIIGAAKLQPESIWLVAFPKFSLNSETPPSAAPSTDS